MCEFQYRVNGVPAGRAPIDFCYLRPKYIPAVNEFLQSIFWSGINSNLIGRWYCTIGLLHWNHVNCIPFAVSGYLWYPDYTILAMYRKLIIGCAFLTTQLKSDEAYITFIAVRPGWDKAGIGSFMINHLMKVKPLYSTVQETARTRIGCTNPPSWLIDSF